MTEIIEKVAKEQGIDPKLLLAICTVESSLNPFAIRYEPAWSYYYFVNEHASRLGITQTTERVLQACSYGLAQIMGSVARSYGYSENLTKMFSGPEIPLRYSAMHLKNFITKYGSEVDAISAYNQGSPRKTPGGLYQNQRYVDKVSQELTKLRALI